MIDDDAHTTQISPGNDQGVTQDGETPADGGLPSPAIGAPVTLVPVSGGRPVHGRLALWTASAGGTVVTSRVRTSLGAVSALRGERVWVSTRAEDDTLFVFQALGHPVPAHREELELTGMTWLATESRRAALRAEIARPVLLVREGVPSRGTQTVDLSAAGCRVQLPKGQDLQPGDRLEAAVDVGAGGTVWARSEVVRVDHDQAQAALRFVQVTDDDRERLDRDVLAWYSEQSAT